MKTKGMMKRTLLLVAALAIMAMLVAVGRAGAFPPLAATLQPGMAVESAPVADASKAEAGLLAITPSRISYQGRLTDPATGLPKPDGAYSLTFRLYDAATGGTLLQTVSQPSVQVKDGLFSTTLDFSQGYFNGQDLYLEIQVGTETLSPRQQLTTVPYALGLRPGVRMQGAISVEALLTAENTAADGTGLSGFGRTGVHGGSSTSPGVGLFGSASGSPGVGVLGWNSPIAPLLPTASYGVYGYSSAGAGVYGENGSPTRLNWPGVYGKGTADDGVWGESTSGDGVRGVSSSGAGVLGASTSGTGVHAQSSAGPGVVSFSNATAVFAASTNGVGVHGVHSAATGTDPGVLGATDSTADYAAGVIGRVTSTSPGGASAGVRGINEGTGDLGMGVWGSHNGSGSGVHGTSVSGWGVAGFSGSQVVGWMVPPGPPAAGVYGESSSGDGVLGISGTNIGVFGRNMNTSRIGDRPGVFGRGDAEDGGHFISTQGNGLFAQGGNWGAWISGGQNGLRVDSGNGDGVEASTATQNKSAVYAHHDGNQNGYGVWATTGTGIGVYGASLGAGGTPGPPAGVGVHGEANGIGGIGVRGQGGAYGIWSQGDARVVGNLTVSGTKDAVVQTETYGERKLYAIESPGVWFEDFGKARLVDGVAVVEIDPIFAETVNLEAGYHVFLTPVGGWANLYVAAEGPTSFEVRAADGAKDVAFHYRIVARRKGYEEVRLEPAK